MVCSMAQLPPVQFPREFHGRSPGLSSTSKAAGSTSQIFTWGWWITVALQLIGLSENYRTCTYVYTWKKYIYTYEKLPYIYTYRKYVYGNIPYVCIYIHTFIYKKIYRKKTKDVMEKHHRFQHRPIPAETNPLTPSWNFQIYPPVSSNRVCWKCSHLVQCVFQL